MAIRYKVVMADNRFSIISRGQDAQVIEKICLKYEKGTRVKAQPWSIGILTFEKKKQAEEFIKGAFYSQDFEILRVRPIGKGKRITQLLSDHKYRYNILYLAKQEIPYKEVLMKYRKMQAPEGTMAYPEVYVLD